MSSPYPFVPWTWRDPGLWGYASDHMRRARSDRADVDLTGYGVEALDGGIGSVDEASYDTDDSWLVVDTGPWILGRKVLLPAGTVLRIDHGEQKVYVDRDKTAIEHSPDYDPDAFDKADFRERVARYYEDSYRTQPHE